MLQHFKVSTVTQPEPALTLLLNGTSASSQSQPAKTSSQNQETPKRTSMSSLQAFNNTGVLPHRGQTLQADVGPPRSPQPARPKAHTIGKDVKCGKPANDWRAHGRKCQTSDWLISGIFNQPHKWRLMSRKLSMALEMNDSWKLWQAGNTPYGAIAFRAIYNL